MEKAAIWLRRHVALIICFAIFSVIYTKWMLLTPDWIVKTSFLRNKTQLELLTKMLLEDYSTHGKIEPQVIFLDEIDKIDDSTLSPNRLRLYAEIMKSSGVQSIGPLIIGANQILLEMDHTILGEYVYLMNSPNHLKNCEMDVYKISGGMPVYGCQAIDDLWYIFRCCDKSIYRNFPLSHKQ